MSTILIVGAGPGLGLSVAKKFGNEGFNVALLARNPQKMERMLEELHGLGITAEGFLCDYLDAAALEQALDSAIERFGFIDTVELQLIGTKNMPSGDALASRKPKAGVGIINLEPQQMMDELEVQIVPIMQIVNKLLPAMQMNRENSISGFIVTMGWSGIWPSVGNEIDVPYHILRKVPIAVAYSAVIKYLTFLNAQMCYDNIYAVANMLGVWIKKDTPHDPDIIANAMYENVYLPRQKDPMARRKVVEVFPEGITTATDLIRY